MKLCRRIAFLGICLCLVAVFLGGSNAKAGTSNMGIVYGDSLTVQAEGALKTWMLPSNTVYQAYGGTAICDWVDRARSDRTRNPSWVILAFTGNTAGGTCAGDAFAKGGVSGAVENYRTALQNMRLIFPASTKIYVVASPEMNAQKVCSQGNTFSCWFPFNGAPELNTMYLSESKTLPNVEYIPDASDLVSYHIGIFGLDFCLPGECSGTIVVRASDGVHLTDAGAFRYAVGMTAGVRRDFR